MKNNSEKKLFDLEKRTIDFSKRIISLCKKEVLTIVSKPLISQLMKSGTSIGANYHEANGSDSKKDFSNKISICKK